MAMPSDFADDLIRSNKTISSDIMLKLILAYQKSIAISEDDIIIDNFIFSPLIDSHDTIINVIPPVFDTVESDDNIASATYKKLISIPVHSDPLIYDFSNASGLTFNKPNSGVGARFMGAAIANGNSFIKILDDPILKITNFLIITCWVYLKPNGIECTIINKEGSYKIIKNNANEIAFSLVFNGAEETLEHIPITTAGWFHIVATQSLSQAKQHLFVNGVSVVVGGETGTIDVTTNDLGIFANPTGSNKMQSGEGISWISVINGHKGQSWVNNDFIGKRDLTGMDEVLCFPFMGDKNPQPPMTSGLFASGP